jgi:hypothetical protein
MKKLLILLFFVSWLGIGQEVYYVSNSGSAANTGLSEGSPWTLAKAFTDARPGDVVWIKKGIYSNLKLTINISGTSSAKITFKGYNSTINDVNSTTSPTHDWGDAVDANELPLLRETRAVANVGTGTALQINGSHLVFENIKFQYYATTIRVSGNNNTLDNIHVHEAGDLSGAAGSGVGRLAYSGKGIQVFGAFNTLTNIFVEKCDAEGIAIKGNDNVLNGIEVHESQNVNPMDYYLLVQGGSRNEIYNTLIWRHGNLSHYGHGISFKSPNPTQNNVVQGFVINNTNLEVAYQGSSNNIFRDGVITRLADGGGSDNIGGILLTNASHSNHFQDIFVDNSMIRFAAWLDGLPGLQTGLSSYNNTFNRVTVNSPWSAVAFYFFGQEQYASPANNNKFYNCTFHRMATSNFSQRWLFERSRANSGTEFTNCIFSGFTSYGSPRSASPGYTVNATWTKNNLFNSSVGSITGSQSGTTTVDPLFTNANAKDFSLQISSTLRGEGVATPYMAAGNDIGAWQSEDGPPADVTAPNIVGDIVITNITTNSFTAEWNLDEGSKGRIYLDTDSGTVVGDYAYSTTLENSFIVFHRQTVGGSNPMPLTPNTLYYARVYMEDAAGNTRLSSQFTVTTLGEEIENPNPDPTPITIKDLRAKFLKKKKLF